MLQPLEKPFCLPLITYNIFQELPAAAGPTTRSLFTSARPQPASQAGQTGLHLDPNWRDVAGKPGKSLCCGPGFPEDAEVEGSRMKISVFPCYPK